MFYDKAGVHRPTTVVIDMESIVRHVVEAGVVDWLRDHTLSERQRGDLDILARVGKQLDPQAMVLDDGARRVAEGKLVVLRAWLKQLGEHVRRNDARALVRGRDIVMRHLREMHEAIVRHVEGTESKAAVAYGSRVLAATKLLSQLQPAA